MHKNATKRNETLSKWCKNKYGASKIIDTLETYHLYISYFVFDRGCWTKVQREKQVKVCEEDEPIYVEENNCELRDG
jgi:hypothetical protein